MMKSLAILAVVTLTLPLGAFAEEIDIQRFERTTIAVDLIQPMELDIAPDGRIFLIEVGGTVKLIDPQSGQIDTIAQLSVTTAQENGLIGLALDPNFADNGWVYLQYSPPDYPGQHISRFDFRDAIIDLSTEKLLFKYEEQRQECCHHAGSLEFGPDGNLYVGTGDNTNPFEDSKGYAPIDEREGRSPWDAQRSAGNTKSYNGKVLRIRPETDGTYSIPDGNLFPKDGSIGHPEIYVMGCRNPWRINIDKKTGYLYWGDVGPDAGSENELGPRGYDEINQARVAGNFGWPYFIGNNFAYSMYDFVDGVNGPRQEPTDPRNDSVNNTGSKVLPPAQSAMVYYPSSASSEFPEMGEGGRTACAGPVYYFDPNLTSTNKFPAAYDSTLFAFEWSRSTLFAIHLDDHSNVERIEPFLTGMKFSRPIDLQFDAGGSLYMIEYGETWGVNTDARLVRIDYVRGNRAPLAVASVSNDTGREPLVVKLTGEDSYDKDGDELTYAWSIVPAGVINAEAVSIAASANATTTISEPGVYTALLTVRDPSGSSSTTSLPIIVGNARPEVEFLEPSDGDFYAPGEPIRYSIVVRDHEDGTSDFELAEDDDDLEFIDSAAATRLFVEASSVVSASSAATEVPGLALIRKTDCLNCHATHRPLVGPSFVEIAMKYRDQPHQVDLSVQRVMNGSTGVWGKVGMLPHQQHTAAEVRQMVEYVFSTTADASNPSAIGFNNSILTAAMAPEEGHSGAIRLDASYTDLGRGEIPKLAGRASVTLRNRTLQAESADEFKGTTKLGGESAQGKHFMGGIEHNGFLKFENVRLNRVDQVTVRVASAGFGGTIELRQGGVEGRIVGSTTVEVNGDWEAFYEKTMTIEASPESAPLYVVFKNDENRSGLMNLDSIHFQQ